MSNRQRIATLSFILVMLFPKASAALEPVRLQLRWHHGFQFAGYYMAKEKGLYQEVGLDVAIAEGGVKTDQFDQVLHGHANYGVATSELIIEYAKGKPFRSMGVIFQHSPYSLLVRKNSGLNNPQQLVGKTVYIGIITRTAEIQAMLIHEGVSFDKLRLIDATTSLPDYTDPDIDAFSVYETNEPFVLKQHGIETDLIRPINYGIDFYGDCLFSTSEELEKHGERSRSFLLASLRGWRYAFDHPEETISLVFSKYNTENRSREHLRYEHDTMRQLVLPDHIPLGQQNQFRWERIAQTYFELGMAPQEKNIIDFVYDPQRDRARKLRQYQHVSIWVLMVVSALALLLYFGNRTLKAHVRRRTRSLYDETLSHRATQKQLREAFTKYQTLFNSFPLGITVSDETGKIIETNRAAEKLVAVSAPEHEKRRIDGQEWKIVRPDGTLMPPSEYAGMRALNENRRIGNAEMGLVTSNGEIVWLDVTAAPIPLEGYGVVVTYGDITERKQIEREHRENKEKFEQFFANIPDCAYMISGDGTILNANKVAIKTLGYNKEELVGRHLSEIYAPESTPKMIRLFDQWKQTGYIKDEEMVLMTRQREKRTVILNASAVKDQDGKILYSTSIQKDITERKQAEDRMRFQAHLLNSVQQAIIATDPAGTIIYWNRFAEILYGWSANDAVGRDVIDVTVPQPTVEQAQEIMATLANGDSWHGEFVVRRKDGGTFPADVMNSPVHNAEGELVAIIGISSDITERRTADERLKSSLAEKEILLRELYHRTKNTLQVVRSMLLLQAARMTDCEPVQQLVADTENRIMAMALVHEKLYQSQDLSRIPIQNYLEELADLIIQSTLAPDRNISLSVECAPLSMLIDTAIPLGLLVTELISNALKHAFPDQRQGKIVIRLVRNRPERLELTFADNGVGVPPGFDFRKQQTLGLQTMIAIAEHQMRGRVSFASDQGVTCSIEFSDTLYSERV